jgi:hypothetical protein
MNPGLAARMAKSQVTPRNDPSCCHFEARP